MPTTILIVDPDAPTRGKLKEQLTAAPGFTQAAFLEADSVATARNLITNAPLTHALIEPRLAEGDGLDLLPVLSGIKGCRKVVWTSQASVAEAVAAMKAGADDYLVKPAPMRELARCLLGNDAPAAGPITATPMLTPERLRWEYIQRTFLNCDKNVSVTARTLRMHRRTLQRILAKGQPL